MSLFNIEKDKPENPETKKPESRNQILQTPESQKKLEAGDKAKETKSPNEDFRNKYKVDDKDKLKKPDKPAQSGESSEDENRGEKGGNGRIKGDEWSR